MDICPCNICPGNICPYQQYLSCYWPDFDKILKVGSWELDFYRRQNQTKKFIQAQIKIFVWQLDIIDIAFCQTKFFIWFQPKKIVLAQIEFFVWQVWFILLSARQNLKNWVRFQDFRNCHNSLKFLDRELIFWI